MNEPNLDGHQLDYEPMPPAWNLNQARRLLARLNGDTHLHDSPDTERDPGDCDDCHQPVWVRHPYGNTPLALCSPCLRRRQRVNQRLQHEDTMSEAA